MDATKLKTAVKDTLFSFKDSLPILIGVILLLGIADILIPKETYSDFFIGNSIFDPIIGATIGSMFAGNPITGYIIGGEFLNQGLSTITVAAFLMAWVTVGLMQLPIEMAIMGKKFAIVRAILAYISAILVAIALALTLKAII